MQEFTQSGGVRPFGVSLLVAGFDDNGPQLYQVDPSGSYFSWKASAMGKNVSNAKTFLEKRYTDDMELDDAVHTAMLTLKEGFEGQISGKNIEIGIIGADKKFRVLTPAEIDDYLAEGTLMALVAFYQGQVLNKFRSAALLSPIAHMNQMTSILTKIAAVAFLANGPNCCLNSSTIDVFLDHEPQPTSTKNLVHLSQNYRYRFVVDVSCYGFGAVIRTGTIAKYDYGDQGQNMQHYGQPLPPLYDMTGIPNEFPLFLSYGGQDTLSDAKDVQVLLNDLKDHDRNKLVVMLNEDYAHVDFVMGVNANQMIYDPMMDFFKVN
ncbi:Proteasome subunit alpha type-2-A [Glycine soja]|nr:Proteasome subunit alpha type-2-A [Glycine soja]